ncbi:uncharacterized protein BDCG_17090 [Blastomyces dermatitidis ER-3]|uniref:Uncharacterized protein n=1 Tax=Ajellomyces dermatitidis (strain ER-3 / ATCC MYA-2586) TaxID=559297 RepID=A0ABX2VWC0_AJEDR|nr:uncharacterized protein BDCG_17090 [Blastomyces dermatitidis ER-3]OAT01445.1 hypothetical protein BDCG_17090 [Blastomyces dermatitidis ER-3]
MASPPTKVTETAKEKKKRNNRRSNVNWDEPPELESASEDDACNDPETPYKERSIWSGHLRDAFVRSLIIPSPQSGDLGCTFTPPENTGPWEDFTPVFLKQARLYVLADKYGIDLLCQLVLSKLHQTLRTFKLYDTGVSGIVDFVRFVYLNTPPNQGSRVDAMRNFTTCYVVSVLGQIGENECFLELLEEGGPFICDFWHIIWSVKESSSVCSGV